MMLIANVDDNNAEAPKEVLDEQRSLDPPPTYTSAQSSSATAEPASSSSFSYNAVNYVSISRPLENIKETLKVDPSRHIPEAFQAPLPEGETESQRKNVRLETVRGNIEADITIFQGTAALDKENPQRATVQLSSTYGNIKATIHDHTQRPPLLLTVKQTHNGNIGLTLPRSFTGPIAVSYEHGEIKASELGADFIMISEANGKMKGFIGDLSRYSEYGGEGKGWKGDELEVDKKYGSVRLRFYQEKEDPAQQPKMSVLSKVFGLS